MSSSPLRAGSVRRTRARTILAALALALVAPLASAQGPPPASYEPPWADAVPDEVLVLERDPALGPTQNGALLEAAVTSLVPGQRLEIGEGTWSVNTIFNVDLAGTPQKPIWIVAKKGAEPVITRPNAKQNVVNVGVFSTARYLVLRGLEVTGGSMGVRFYSCSNVWLDRCHIHHTGQAGFTANTRNTDNLYLTRNEIHHTSGTGEGMYLGANGGKVIMRDSVVALNHVHHTGGSQGDGIEVKEGSWGNWIVENEVHDTKYPCLLLYGTGGKPRNLVERNILYRSNDNVLQVQGDAIVQNNLVMAGKYAAFHSHDHQGPVQHLWMMHNTFVNIGRAANLVHWNDRPGMILANNAFYSRDAEAVYFHQGAKKVLAANNFVYGPVVGGTSPNPTAFLPGQGIGDFVDAAWGAKRRDAQPAPDGALAGAGAWSFQAERDLFGQERVLPSAVGALSVGSFGPHYGEGFSAQGDAPHVAASGPPELGTKDFALRASGAPPSSIALLLLGDAPADLPFAGGTLLTSSLVALPALTDENGAAERTFPLPQSWAWLDFPLHVQWAVLDPDAPQGWAFTDAMRLVLEVQ